MASDSRRIDPEGVYNVAEVAELLGVTPRTAATFFRREQGKRLQGRFMGNVQGGWLTTGRALRAFLEGRELEEEVGAESAKPA